MDNSRKPEGTVCPKCAGFYSWEHENGRCLCCGYQYNPTIAAVVFKVPHCCFGQCVRPIDSIRQIFCPIHKGEVLTKGTVKNMNRQERYTPRKGNQDEPQIRLNTPIMVKLKSHHKKTVA